MLFHVNEKGQGLVEYALILLLVAVAVIAILCYLWVNFIFPWVLSYLLPTLKAAWESA